MPHLRWTLEKFRIPLGKVLLVGEMFVIAPSGGNSGSSLGIHAREIFGSLLSEKRKRAFSLPLMERKRKARWRQTSLDLILVDDYTINHSLLAGPDIVDADRDADSDSGSHRVFIENSATPGHISDRITEAITDGSAGFSQNDCASRSVLRDCSISFRSGRRCGCFRNLSPRKGGHNCQGNA